jgi:hypothetical protein
MSEWIEDRLSDNECERIFARLFPHGFGGEDVLAEIAPAGWEASAWIPVFHPSVQRVFQESLQLHRNIERLRLGRTQEPNPPPTFEGIQAEYEPTPPEPKRECQELVCRCLWQVFSDNHEVITPERKGVDIGSFRGAAGFLADLLNREIGRTEYDYMSFYMGLAWLEGRADFTDVYAMIFRRLKAQDLDWVYHFPRLNLVDLAALKEELEADKPDLNYDPSAAFEEERQKNKHAEEVARMRQELDEAHEQALERARQSPPPQIVNAYRRTYAHWPGGWPP